MEDEIKTLESEIERLCTMSNLLQHRLDTIERLIHNNQFELEKQPIKSHPGREDILRPFLQTLELEESGLTVGVFLQALNRHLIRSRLVDLNDLEIILTEELRTLFLIDESQKKVPYAILLRQLPELFE